MLYDPHEPQEVRQGDLVAAIGTRTGSEMERLLDALAADQPIALAIRDASQLASEAIIAAAERSAIAVLLVRPGAAWTQVVLLMSSVLSRHAFGTSADGFAGTEAGDLFSIANVISELVDAPVTIEDTRSRVVAYSGRQDEADPARAATILGRAVPEPWLGQLRERGIMQRLLRERKPVYIEGLTHDSQLLPRAAITIRAGDQVLGSIWAAVKGPLKPERERALVDAANFVALHLLRHRLVSDAESTLEQELAATVLKGGSLAGEAAYRLQLGQGPLRVIAATLDPQAESTPGEDAMALDRCRSLLALHLSHPQRRVATLRVGASVYAIVPTGAASISASGPLREAVEQFVQRAATLTRQRVVAAIGSQVECPAEIPASRATADLVLRVLRSDAERTVADISDVRSNALFLRFADACGDDPGLGSGPLGRLRDHDTQNRTAYVETLRAYLDAFGDVDAAAQALGVHANTVRYRLRQLQAMDDLRLNDPSARLALMLELRLA